MSFTYDGLDPDVVVTSLQRVIAARGSLFGEYHPTIRAVIKRSGKPRVENAPFVEFGLVDSSPHQVTALNTGTEIIETGRQTGATKANSFPQRLAYAYEMPAKMLADIGSAQDLLRLIDQYPVRSRLGFMQQLVRQLMMGNEPGFEGVFTFNGEATYSPSGTNTRNGLFEALAPESQVGNLHGITKNSVLNWHHQYGHIATGYNTDGRKTIRETLYDAASQGEESLGEVDIMLADRGTFDNVINELEGFLAIDAKTITGDPGLTQRQFRDGVPFSAAGGPRIYSEKAIRISDFSSANSQRGVLWGINSRGMHIYRKGRAMATDGWFSERKPTMPARQDVIVFVSLLHFGMYFDNPRACMMVTGGAVA